MSYICEKCGKEFEIDWRTDKSAIRKCPIPRFCSRRCSNSRTWSKESIQKLSESMKSSDRVKEQGRKTSERWKNKDYRKLHTLYRITKICPVCGKEFESVEKYNKIYCSESCRRKNSGGCRENSGRSKSGYYKGIYCGSTYELCWVIYNIDKGIKFKRSSLQIPYTYKGKQHKYNPDFELEDGTLIEIKGYWQETVDAKKSASEKLGYKILILYEDDLKEQFDYVKNNYSYKFESLYDTYKPDFTYVCEICGKEFTRKKESKSLHTYCSRRCSGKGMIKFKK